MAGSWRPLFEISFDDYSGICSNCEQFKVLKNEFEVETLSRFTGYSKTQGFFGAGTLTFL